MGWLAATLSWEMGEKLMPMEDWSSADVNKTWDIIASCIRETTTQVPGVSRGNYGGHRGDGWWNEEVQGKVEAKKVVCKVGGLQRHQGEADK